MQTVAPTNTMNERIALIDRPRIVKIKHFASDSGQPNGHMQKMEHPVNFYSCPYRQKQLWGSVQQLSKTTDIRYIVLTD